MTRIVKKYNANNPLLAPFVIEGPTGMEIRRFENRGEAFNWLEHQRKFGHLS